MKKSVQENTGRANSQENRWKDFFDEKNNKRKIWIEVVIISIVAIILAEVFSKIIENIAIDVIFGVVENVSIGLLSAAVLNLFYFFSENSKLKRIRSLLYDELLTEIFQGLENFDGRYRRDEKVDIEFERYEDVDGKLLEGIYEVSMTYSYKTNFQVDFFEIYINRCQNESMNQSGSKGKRAYLYSEFYWESVESDFPEWVEDVNYKIYDVIVDDIPLNEEEKYFESRKEGNQIVYTVKFPDKRSKEQKEREVCYTISFPMKDESNMLFTEYFPTQNLLLTVDYSKVKDEIDISNMNATAFSQPVKNAIKGKLIFKHTGWIQPYTGIVISWNKKKKKL